MIEYPLREEHATNESSHNGQPRNPKIEENEQVVPYNRYQPLCRRSFEWFHGFTPVSSLALAGSGVCTRTFGREGSGIHPMRLDPFSHSVSHPRPSSSEHGAS
jgi:hypothetical protein